MVKMLLARKEITPNKRDDQGQTPLMTVHGKGHKRVIEFLETQEAVNTKPKAKRRRHRLVATL